MLKVTAIASTEWLSTYIEGREGGGGVEKEIKIIYIPPPTHSDRFEGNF